MRYFLLISFTAATLSAQTDRPGSVSAGFLLGAPINDPSAASSVFSTYTQGRWTGGPTELHLPYRFSLEFDALYRRSRFNSSSLFQLGPDVNPYSVLSLRTTNSWDLPLLLKYRFRVGSLRPFVSGGYQFTHESNQFSSIYRCSGPQGSCLTSTYPLPGPTIGQFKYSATPGGIAAGAGIEFKTRYLTIAPEMRFTHQMTSYPHDNRYTALVGFTFGRKR